jgi:uncharacterized protein (UPF0548 family)
VQVLWRFSGRPPRLGDWERRPIHPAIAGGPGARDYHDVHERVIAQETPGVPEADGSFRRVAAAICRYDIFPPAMVEPVLRRAPVEAGDTVGIRYHCLPGIDLFFAARVTACFDRRDGDRWRTGFTYQTLKGHPELGEETFQVIKELDRGTISASLRSWSRPGLWLSWLALPYTRRCQIKAGRAALDHLQAIAGKAHATQPFLEAGARKR